MVSKHSQERVIKTILFILSLLPHAYRPFLIISTAASIPLWENKFERLASSINVVVYNGSKDVRKMIQTLEFYEQGGCIMFQVLLSHPDAVIEVLCFPLAFAYCCWALTKFITAFVFHALGACWFLRFNTL